MNPVVLHIVRPFETEAEFLENEAWTIEARGMLLVDQPALDPDTAVVFDVALASGSKIIRAEGRAVGYLAPNNGRPGGLRVRFRRFGAQTKAFIDRAVSARSMELSRGASALPPRKPSSPPQPLLAAEPDVPSPAKAVAGVPEDVALANSKPSLVSSARREEPSGVHSRPAAPVVTPINRDELLARLRAWSKDKTSPPSVNARRS